MSFVIGAVVIGYGIYVLSKSLKKQIKGDCGGCSGCSSKNCGFRTTEDTNEDNSIY